ncbi:protein of unknown function, might be Chloride channel [Shewanella benthica]|uniref:Uncharacterized protein n=1 Tax=Shewanella benthica TaxID=43661 RepID=A0A330LZY0_9GAMM|nr:protein of unknown function, might be Chloride channel [Shewanella benthica]
MQKRIKNTYTRCQMYLRTDLQDKLFQAKLSLQLCMLALLFALIASGVIILFRLLLLWLNNYTQTSELEFTEILDDWRVLLPILGALLIWLVARMGSQRYKRMGIA